MSSDSGWWQRHLAPVPGSQAPRPIVANAVMAPAAPPAPPPVQPQWDGQQWVVPNPTWHQPGQPPTPPQAPVDPNQIQVTEDNFTQVMGLWRGGEAHRPENMVGCPKCGSQHYSRRSPTGATRGPQPAPMCFTCGFNGMFDQGDPATWQATG